MLFQGKLELSSIKKCTIQFYKIWFIEIDNIDSPISELFRNNSEMGESMLSISINQILYNTIFLTIIF